MQSYQHLITIEEVHQVVDAKIRAHEVRVGWISGAIGLFFTFGIVHSIWLMKQLML